MGESYLQRKFFNKMKRLRTQTSISSAQTSSMDSKWSPMPNNSNSSPQLNLVRDGPLGSDMDCSISSMGSDIGDENSSCPNNCTTQPPGGAQNRLANDGRPSVTKRLGISKLKSASRAILFFHRATNSSSTPNNTNKNRSTGHLPSSTSAEDPNSSSQAVLDGSAKTTNANQVPHFIVPKVNALKLPLVCLIKSLDGELMREVFVHRYELGQYLIESLKVSVGINDCKYFGLKMAKSFDDQEDLKNSWLDLNESVCKQIKNKTNLINTTTSSSSNNHLSALNLQHHQQQQSQSTTNQRSIDFYLRIKFYPPNLARVQDPFLRNYLWLQLRRDLRLGKLTSSMNNLTLLMACVLQYELGDYREDLVEKIPELNILPNQDLIEEQANELWSRRLIGYKRHQAQMQFLRAAVILETYGFDYYPVRDHQRQRAYLLGFNYAGIKTIRNGRIAHHFSWHSLSKISYERRMIIFHIYPMENSKRKQILGFKCLSNEDCQNLYMRLLEQKYFFTVDLAYFDKSIRRPTCLYPNSASQVLADDNWSPPTVSQVDETYENRFTSCGPSLDTNDDSNMTHLFGNTTNGSGNSLESRESQNSSSNANCYTCEREQNADCAESTNAKSNECSAGNLTDTGNGHQGFKVLDRLQSNDIHRNHQAPNDAVSLRRTQWHRQRPARQYFSGADENLVDNGSQCENEPDQGSRKEERIWKKVLACIKSCEINSRNGVSQRLAEFAETFLQPMNSILCFNNDDNNAPELSRRPTTPNRTYFQVMMPAIRFCLMILVMNFVIRCTDSIASSLIELFTLNPTGSGGVFGDEVKLPNTK